MVCTLTRFGLPITGANTTTTNLGALTFHQTASSRRRPTTSTSPNLRPQTPSSPKRAGHHHPPSLRPLHLPPQTPLLPNQQHLWSPRPRCLIGYWQGRIGLSLFRAIFKSDSVPVRRKNN